MNIPHYRPSPVVDKDGYFTTDWGQRFMLLFQQLNLNNSNLGTVIPGLTSAQIADLNLATTNPAPQPDSGSRNQTPAGSLIYNTTTEQLLVNIGGVLKIVTVT